MKTKYIKPESEVVVIKLQGSVLDTIGLGGQSTRSNTPLAKHSTYYDDIQEEFGPTATESNDSKTNY